MTAAENWIDRLIRENDIIILCTEGRTVRRVAYRGKHTRSDVLQFLRSHIAGARAIVYSHESDTGPRGIDIKSGEMVTWR